MKTQRVPLIEYLAAMLLAAVSIGLFYSPAAASSLCDEACIKEYGDTFTREDGAVCTYQYCTFIDMHNVKCTYYCTGGDGGGDPPPPPDP